MIIENGIIKSAELKIGPASCLVFNLYIEIQSGGTRFFGNISLGHQRESYSSPKRNAASNYGAYYITKVFRCCGVENIKDIEGKPIRVIIDEKEDKTIGLQHFINNDEWFIPAVDRGQIMDLTPLNLKDYNNKKQDFIEIDGVKFEASRFITGYNPVIKACEECCFGEHHFPGAAYGDYKHCDRVRCCQHDFEKGNRNVWITSNN